MLTTIPLVIAGVLAVGIIGIGCTYLSAPERISGSFGLKPPAADRETRAWLRLKGNRDVVSGLVVLTVMLTGGVRLTGIVLLVESLIAFGDMSIILGSGGSKSTAFSVHGVTWAVMVAVGVWLVRVG